MSLYAITTRLLRYFDVHERCILLPAVPVAVAGVALETGPGNGGLDRTRMVAEEELHLPGLEPVALGDDFTRDGA